MSSTPTKHIEGDVAVGRHVTMGGDATVRGSAVVGHNLKVKGWLDAPNVRKPLMGLFRSDVELRETFPHPMPGWFALVGDTLPAAVYRAYDGKWDPTGEVGGEISLPLNKIDEDIAELRNEVSTVRTIANEAKGAAEGAVSAANNAAAVADAAVERAEEADKAAGQAIQKAGDTAAKFGDISTEFEAVKKQAASAVAVSESANGRAVSAEIKASENAVAIVGLKAGMASHMVMVEANEIVGNRVAFDSMADFIDHAMAFQYVSSYMNTHAACRLVLAVDRTDGGRGLWLYTGRWDVANDRFDPDNWLPINGTVISGGGNTGGNTGNGGCGQCCCKEHWVEADTGETPGSGCGCQPQWIEPSDEQ